MRKIFRLSSRKAGLPPGTLIHIGERKAERAEVDKIAYNGTGYEVTRLAQDFPFASLRESDKITWINITGIHDIELIRRVGEAFGLHSLTQEDILNSNQRPKVEDYPDYVFIALKMLYWDPESEELAAEHVSLVVGDDFVLSFQESPKDVFDGVRQRLRDAQRRIRERGSDYLAYALLDAVVDHYFIVLEKVGDRLDALEDDLLDRGDPMVVYSFHANKRQLIFLRRAVWPLRDVLSYLGRGQSKLFRDDTLIYLRDVHDHAMQILETIESLRDAASGLHDTYLSSISNRMNEIMKVLTMFATIFIPLTFLVGVYGMNFEHMPELHWRYGYHLVWAIMMGTVLGMLYYFRRRKWL